MYGSSLAVSTLCYLITNLLLDVFVIVSIVLFFSKCPKCYVLGIARLVHLAVL